MTIAIATTAQDLADICRLFRAYAASLPVDLAYQDFATELATLPGRYARPGGALLLARDEAGEATGCVALRAIVPGACGEMKRLYVAPKARGRGLGRSLLHAVVVAARELGYREIRLDTLPGMTEARALYTREGFCPIPPYYDTPVCGTTFMALRIQ